MDDEKIKNTFKDGIPKEIKVNIKFPEIYTKTENGVETFITEEEHERLYIKNLQSVLPFEQYEVFLKAFRKYIFHENISGKGTKEIIEELETLVNKERNRILKAGEGKAECKPYVVPRQKEILKAFNDVTKELYQLIAKEPSSIPDQGVFFEGQVFDAHEFASEIIRSAKSSIVLIDNYIDEKTITLLTKKNKNVTVLLLTKTIGKQLELDIEKANQQYGGFTAKQFTKSHDRFLFIDDGKEVYHVGASLKDLGKKCFAFSKIDKKDTEKIVEWISSLL